MNYVMPGNFIKVIILAYVFRVLLVLSPIGSTSGDDLLVGRIPKWHRTSLGRTLRSARIYICVSCLSSFSSTATKI